MRLNPLGLIRRPSSPVILCSCRDSPGAIRRPTTSLRTWRLQTEQCLKNIATILEAAGSSLSKVIRCGVFLVDMNDFKKMNDVYARMFGEHRPARTTVAVTELPGPGLRVEIDAVAMF